MEQRDRVTDPQIKGRARARCQRVVSWKSQELGSAARAFPVLVTHSLTFLATSWAGRGRGKSHRAAPCNTPCPGHGAVGEGFHRGCLVPSAACWEPAVARTQSFSCCITHRNNLELHLGKHERFMSHSS